jgi:hypothetical protein
LDFTLGFKPNPKPLTLTLDPFVNSEGGKTAAKTELVHGSKVQLRLMGGFIGGSKRKILHCLEKAQEQDMVFVATLLGTILKGVGSYARFT